MNDIHLKEITALIKDGNIKQAIKRLALTNNRAKIKAVRNTIQVMAKLDDDEWEQIDKWIDQTETESKERENKCNKQS